MSDEFDHFLTQYELSDAEKTWWRTYVDYLEFIEDIIPSELDHLSDEEWMEYIVENKQRELYERKFLTRLIGIEWQVQNTEVIRRVVDAGLNIPVPFHKRTRRFVNETLNQYMRVYNELSAQESF